MTLKGKSVLMLAIALAASVACGYAQGKGAKATGLKKATFRLNYYASGLHAPFYVALEKGYYKEQGLDVSIGEGTGSGTTAKLIGNQSDTFGFVDAATTATAITQGIPIRVVSPIYAVNAFAIIALADSGIDDPKKLEGKRVGITTGDAPSKLFEGIAAANKIDVSAIKFVSMDASAKVSALANKQVDAILGGADAQALQAKKIGLDIKVLRYSDFGVPTIGLSIIANNSVINSDPDLVRRFIAASLKGWDYARSNKAEAIKIERKYLTTLDADQSAKELDVALSCLFSADSASIGKSTAADWESTIKLLRQYMGVDKTFPIEAFYTDDCLPDKLPSK